MLPLLLFELLGLILDIDIEENLGSNVCFRIVHCHPKLNWVTQLHHFNG